MTDFGPVTKRLLIFGPPPRGKYMLLVFVMFLISYFWSRYVTKLADPALRAGQLGVLDAICRIFVAKLIEKVRDD